MRKLIRPDHPILRQVSKRVVQFDTSLTTLIHDMIAVMADEKGIGIAAPQVGVLKRVIVILSNNYAFPMVNPEITYFSEDKEVGREGCLSYPGKFINVERSTHVEVKFHDVKGKIIRLKPPDKAVCRIISHEIDHLNGILFVDREIKIL